MSLTGAALLLAQLCAKDDAMRQLLQSSYADLCVFAVAAVSIASKLMGTRTCMFGLGNGKGSCTNGICVQLR